MRLRGQGRKVVSAELSTSYRCSPPIILDPDTTASQRSRRWARPRRHGADARRRQNLRRRLSARCTRKISGAAGVRHLQQGHSGSGHGGGAAAAAGLVDAMDRTDGGRRHEVLRLARLCACYRLAARGRQIGRRRIARMGLLRPDRVDRGAAVVRRQCRHGRHFRLRRRAACGGEKAAAASAGDFSVRFARRLW